jgi:hypothetical protein
MLVTVEFTGLARSVVGRKTTTLNLEEDCTYQEIIRELWHSHPELIGLLIDRDGDTFLSGNMFIIDGNLETPAFVMDEKPRDQEHLIIMSLVTGG